MNSFSYREGALFVEEVPVAQLVKQYATPLYLYSRASLTQAWYAAAHALQEHPHLICYAVKANSNVALLQYLARLGAGFDIVSVGELERVLMAGGVADKIVFSGVAKQAHEIERAQQVGIACFNVESAAELDLIHTISRYLNKPAPIALRINPDIDANTHPYISTGMKENKFGIDIQQALALYQYAATLPFVRIIGMACHIGSQLTTLAPFVAACDRLLTLHRQLQAQGIVLQHIDMGGGLGVCYHTEQPPSVAQYAEALLSRLRQDGLGLRLIVEPGRALVANSAVLITRVVYCKHNAEKNFLLVDAGMNDLLRPALYQAWHEIIPVQQRTDVEALTYDVAGPVCESSDVLGSRRCLRVMADDLLAIRDVGAYGASMSSRYNSRPRAAEVLVTHDQWQLIRERETFADLVAHERLLVDTA